MKPTKIVVGRSGDDQKSAKLAFGGGQCAGLRRVCDRLHCFLDPLVAWRSKQATRDQPVAEIARRYRECVDLFRSLSPLASSSIQPERLFIYGGLKPCSLE